MTCHSFAGKKSTVPSHAALLHDRYEELKKELQPSCSNLDEKWWADFFGMLLLSAKRPRTPERLENSL